MERASFFRYCPGSTPLHRLPPAPKVVLMVALAVAAFYCPPLPALILWAALAALSAAALRLSREDVLADVRPAIAYAVLLEAASLIQNIAMFRADALPGQEEASLPALALRLATPPAAYAALLARLALSLEISSILYRTTSAMQFHQGLADIERAITRRQDTPLADTLALTLTFIPRMAGFWQQIDAAWRARGGRQNVRRIAALAPVLFRVGMREAYQKALARQNRM